MGVYIYTTTPKAVKVFNLRNTETGEVTPTAVQVYSFYDKTSGRWEDVERQEKKATALQTKFRDAGSKPLELGVVKFKIDGKVKYDTQPFLTYTRICPIEPQDAPPTKFEIVK